MTILPVNATPFEVAVDASSAALLDHAPMADLIWSPWQSPAACLPQLAWALSVDEWDTDWPVDRKRAVIAASFEIHRRKGTPWAVRRALEVLGYGTAQLVETYGVNLHDGVRVYDGAETYADEDHWAEYRLILDRPITLEQAARLRDVLVGVAPARCHLKALDFTRALNIYDGAIRFDGTYSHGVA